MRNGSSPGNTTTSAFPDASPPENRRQKRPSAWPAHRRDVDVELRAELLARCEDDQRIRKEAVQSGPGPRIPSPDLLAELRRIDESNTLWLAELTERVGWRGRGLVPGSACRLAPRTPAEVPAPRRGGTRALRRVRGSDAPPGLTHADR